jgi:hypothetical protein
VRRAAFCVLVIPYALDAFPDVAFALCRNRDEDDAWRVLAAPGARAETPRDAARRVVGAAAHARLLALDSRASIALRDGPGACALPEHAFGVRVDPAAQRVPAGQELLWVSYEVADGLLRRDAERNALWELRRRLGLAPACR